MKFIDEVTIQVAAGHGGAGASHFRREKFVPHGGPDGGDGGKGGSVFLLATHSKRTLLDFSFKSHWQAKKGGAGGTNRKTGKDGDDIILEVPVGTEVYSLQDNSLTADLVEDGQKVCLVKGGRGGKGNAFFKSATNQAPEHAQKGTPGEEGDFTLSLKLLADIGLVGLPNAGKSTFLSTISEAKPKIADYPFTTLKPQLGLVRGPGKESCVVADIPGLIAGAHEGKGLGLEFLKHIERTSILAHLIDCTPLSVDPETEQLKEEKEIIERELNEYPGELGSKPRIYLLTKTDLLPTEWTLEKLKKAADLKDTDQVFPISSATRSGIQEPLSCFFKALQDQEN